MNKNQVRKINYTFYLIIILFLSTIAILIVISHNKLVMSSPVQSNTKNKILILTDSSINSNLSDIIKTQGPGSEDNYTIINSDTYDSLGTLLSTIDINNYHSLFFMIHDFDNEFLTSEDVNTLTSINNNGISLTFISSHIGRANTKLLDLLGIRALSEDTFDSEEESITFIIRNDSFLEFPYSFDINQELNTSAQISFIEPNTINITEVAITDTIEEANNSRTGIYLKSGNLIKGEILVIPLSFDESIDNSTASLITSLSYYVITQGTERQFNFIPDTSTKNHDYPKNTTTDKVINLVSIPEGVLLSSLTIISILGVSAGGLAVGRKLTRSSKYIEKDEVWPVKTPLISLFVAPLVWIFAQIIYPPKIRKLTYDKMIENEMRRKILNLLEQRQFEHFNALQKILNSGVSITRWHLQVLEDFGKIKSLKVGQYKIFYLSGTSLDNTKVVLYCKIRSKIALNIIRLFFEHRVSTWDLKKLSEALTSSQEIIGYHLSKLSELGLVKYNKNKNLYQVVDDRIEDLEWLLKRYNFFN